MTDAEWLECTDPTPMLKFFRKKVPDRKVRLFGCACCRRVWHQLVDDRSKRAVEVAELLVDGLVTMKELDQAKKDAMAAYDVDHPAGAIYAARAATNTVAPFPDSAYMSRYALIAAEDKEAERKHHSFLIRDIFGNPFRPVTLHPRWQSSTVLDLARTIYEERVFERLPILADALMDAGCDSEEIINHCRSDGPHVRGCWVVDLLTGRE